MPLHILPSWASYSRSMDMGKNVGIESNLLGPFPASRYTPTPASVHVPTPGSTPKKRSEELPGPLLLQSCQTGGPVDPIPRTWGRKRRTCAPRTAYWSKRYPTFHRPAPQLRRFTTKSLSRVKRPGHLSCQETKHQPLTQPQPLPVHRCPP